MNTLNIDLTKLHHTFTKKPLLVGGKAMEYYGLRKAGTDIDLIVPEEDVIALIKQYPDRVKDLVGDLGVCPYEFEIWKTICFYDYDYLVRDANDEGDFLIISEERLLFMKALAMKVEKYLKDTQLIVEDIIKKQSEQYEMIQKRNREILQLIPGISYIEKRGPQNY